MELLTVIKLPTKYVQLTFTCILFLDSFLVYIGNQNLIYLLSLHQLKSKKATRWGCCFQIYKSISFFAIYAHVCQKGHTYEPVTNDTHCLVYINSSTFLKLCIQFQLWQVYVKVLSIENATNVNDTFDKSNMYQI